MFDHSWNKGNQRLSQAWEKASKKQDAPAANAAPTSVLLQQLAPDQRKWKGGALRESGFAPTPAVGAGGLGAG